ncbi:UNKNOWN [Stylonychia lemnae]|uniref:Uncharacterized protein n=1 Tax=Stylonychia lemnae TaxID=5949 RepID=A0A078AA78_STYLE|nr:UNKNOWN [Stylonychia lemnae]|eukprot:CDW78467.1 UNKNOWN [Stylonychia lemnae]
MIRNSLVQSQQVTQDSTEEVQEFEDSISLINQQRGRLSSICQTSSPQTFIQKKLQEILKRKYHGINQHKNDSRSRDKSRKHLDSNHYGSFKVPNRLGPIDYTLFQNSQNDSVNLSCSKSTNMKHSSNLTIQIKGQASESISGKNDVDEQLQYNNQTVQNQEADQGSNENFDFFDQQRDRAFSSFTQVQTKDRSYSDNIIEKSTNISSYQSKDDGFQIKLIPLDLDIDELEQNLPLMTPLNLVKNKSNEVEISPDNIYHLPFIKSQNGSHNKQTQRIQSYYQYHIEKFKNKANNSQSRDNEQPLSNQSIDNKRKHSVVDSDKKQIEKLNKMMFQLESIKQQAHSRSRVGNQTLLNYHSTSDMKQNRSVNRKRYIGVQEPNNAGEILQGFSSIKIIKKPIMNAYNNISNPSQQKKGNSFISNNNTNNNSPSTYQYGMTSEKKNNQNVINLRQNRDLSQNSNKNQINLSQNEKSQYLKFRLQRQQEK